MFVAVILYHLVVLIASFWPHFIVPLATFMMTMANMEGDESFEASMLGSCEEVVEERICDDELILIKG